MTAPKKKPQKAPITAEKRQVSPLANTNIDQLVAYLANMSQDQPNQASLQGWQLASGVELVFWKGTLSEPMAIQRTAEPDHPVWTILLTDSTSLVADAGPLTVPTTQKRGTMIYLYNHHLSLDVTLDAPSDIQSLLIRLKPAVWKHLLQNPPPHVAEFINDNQPRFHGFDLQTTCDEYFQQLVRGNFESHSPWHRLQATLGICNRVFAQLGQRAPIPAANALRPQDSQRIHKARQLLISDFQNPMSLTEIGSSVGLGRDKLRQLFQQVYGDTPHRYYQQQRMNEARRLILEEGLSAMDAGFQVGYSHLGHFAQEFKKQFGCLPKDCKG
ncbi:MAG: AraC family transcriptional regulator [Bermanella sp.]